MSQRLKVGVVGGGVGANHITAYESLPELLRGRGDLRHQRRQGEGARGRARDPDTSSPASRICWRSISTSSNRAPRRTCISTQARQVLAAGKHVVVEKPFVSSLAEADQLAEAETASGRRVSPIFQYRFANGIRQFQHLRDRGFVGKAYAGTVETHWRRTAEYYDNPWRGRWATELGGCLVTHAIHNHDMLTYLMGPIRAVFARTATRVNDIETEDCAALSLELESGALATLSVTLGSEEDMSRLRLCFAGLTAESNRSPYNAGHRALDLHRRGPGPAGGDRRRRRRGRLPGRSAMPASFCCLHEALTEGGAAAGLDRRRPALDRTG